MPRRRAEFMLDLAQDRVAIGLEGIVAGPDLVDDLDPRILAMRMDADQPAAGPQRSDQRPGGRLIRIHFHGKRASRSSTRSGPTTIR